MKLSAARVSAQRTSWPRSRSRRTKWGVLNAAIPPETPTSTRMIANLLQSLERPATGRGVVRAERLALLALGHLGTGRLGGLLALDRFRRRRRTVIPRHRIGEDLV